MTNSGRGDLGWERYRKARRRRGMAVTIGAVVLVAAAAIVVAVFATRSDTPGAAPSPDASTSSASTEPSPPFEVEGARYPDAIDDAVLRHESTGQCVTVGPEPGNTERDVSVLGECEDRPVVLSLDPVGERDYRVGMRLDADDWSGCWAADEPADEAGYLLAPQECDEDAPQTFRLWGQSNGGYLITVGDLCVGPLGDDPADGTALSTVKCVADGSVDFAVEPR